MKVIKMVRNKNITNKTNTKPDSEEKVIKGLMTACIVLGAVTLFQTIVISVELSSRSAASTEPTMILSAMLLGTMYNTLLIPGISLCFATAILAVREKMLFGHPVALRLSILAFCLVAILLPEILIHSV